MCGTIKMKIFILIILFVAINCEDVKSTCDRTGNVYFANNTVVMDMKEACKSKPCVFKCCDIDHYLYYNVTLKHYECLHIVKFEQLMDVSQIKFDFSDYPIYKSDEPENKTKSKNKFFVDYDVLVNKNFKFKECKYWVNQTETPTRMLEDGRIYTRVNNTKFEKDDSLEYCVDKCIFYSTKAKKTKYNYMVYILAETQTNKHINKTVFTGIAMVISSFFMGLVLLVYSILKHLRNIQGMLLMGYLATYVIGNVLKATSLLSLTYGRFYTYQCKYLTPFMYGFIMSSFLWMNVISFDIWWTFRATRKIRSLHRQGELMKFMWYALYAWGTPAAIAIIAFCIDNSDNVNILKPRFETCFSDKDSYIYLYVPILIIVFINTLLFLVTLYNLWLIKRAMSDYDSPRQGKIKMNRNRFWVYIKLSLIMGVGWILELIQGYFQDSSDWVYILFNTPNVLGGVAIFFMFVFKKSIYTKLAKKCKISTRSTERNIEYSGCSKSKTNNTESTGWTLNQQKHENIEA